MIVRKCVHSVSATAITGRIFGFPRALAYDLRVLGPAVGLDFANDNCNFNESATETNDRVLVGGT